MKRADRIAVQEAIESSSITANLALFEDAALAKDLLTYLAERPNARMIDMMLRFPDCDPATIRAIVKSPSFVAIVAESSKSIDPVEYTLEAVKAANLRHIIDGMRRLNKLIDVLDAPQLIASVSMAHRNMGMGSANQPTVSVTVNDPRRLSDEELERIVSVQSNETSQARAPEDPIAR